MENVKAAIAGLAFLALGGMFNVLTGQGGFLDFMMAVSAGSAGLIALILMEE